KNVRIPQELKPVMKKVKEYFNLRPDKYYSKLADDKIFHIYFPGRTFFEPQKIRIRKRSVKTELKKITYLYSFCDYDSFIIPDIKKKYRVSFKKISYRKNRGIYIYHENSGKLSYVDTDYNRRRKRYETFLNRIYPVILLEDNLPPEISILFSENALLIRGEPLIINITDIGMGITESGIELKIDNNPVFFRYDFTRRWIKLLTDFLDLGEHQISVSVKDRGGNISSTNRAFTVVE
ncbi:MAG: hypothetical protein KAS39_06635, partial [Actinomycetia bacterium]|nr:hypothetical protein [Actinomycetes bacterium]